MTAQSRSNIKLTPPNNLFAAVKDVETLIAWLKTQYNVVTVSRPYTNEGTDQIRVYLTVSENRD